MEFPLAAHRLDDVPTVRPKHSCDLFSPSGLSTSAVRTAMFRVIVDTPLNIRGGFVAVPEERSA